MIARILCRRAAAVTIDMNQLAAPPVIGGAAPLTIANLIALPFQFGVCLFHDRV
jgi:hypothetical protein